MKRVLVVDDDPDILECLRDLLESKYEVALAENGADALETLEAQRFDVIVLDLMMPVIDGEELARHLRDRGIEVPVLVASAGHDLPRRSRAMGAADFISKPFDIEEMEQKIARIVGSGGGPPSGRPLRDASGPDSDQTPTGGTVARPRPAWSWPSATPLGAWPTKPRERTQRASNDVVWE